MRFSRPCNLAAAFVVLLPITAQSQDAHYWTNQYGTRSELVGGLVVRRSLDLSSTYYNPGGLAFVRDPGLLFTTNAWELQSFDFEDVAAGDLDLGTTRVRSPPGTFALQLPFSTSQHRFAVSAVTRFSSSIEASATRIPTADAGAPASALEESGTFRLNEGWLGPTWAFRAGPRVGFGVSAYMAVRSQSGRSQTIQQIATPQNSGLTNLDVTEFSYWNVRLLAKLGVEVDLSPLI